MTQYTQTLTWQDQSNPNAPLAPYTLDAAIDQQWNFSLNGTYHNQQIFAKGLTVDNSAGASVITLSSGPWQAVVPQYTRSDVDLSQATQFMTIAIGDKVTKLPIQFFVVKTTEQVQNQFAINQATQAAIAANFLGTMQPIINSGFTEWPDGILITSGVSPSYAGEGWMIKAGNGTSSASQVFQAGINFPIQMAAQLKRNNGSNDVTPIQYGTALQTADSFQYIGQLVTVGFDLTLGATFSGASVVCQLVGGTGTDQNIFSFSGMVILGSIIVPNNAPLPARQNFTIGAVVPPGITQVGLIFSFTPTGVAGFDDSFRISRPQLDIGTVAQQYRPVPEIIERQRCLAFYEIINGAAYGEQINGYRFGVGFSTSSTTAALLVNYIKKRVIPSVAFQNAFMCAFPGTVAVSSFGAPVIFLDRVTVTANFGSAVGSVVPCFLDDNSSIGAPQAQIVINARM